MKALERLHNAASGVARELPTKRTSVDKGSRRCSQTGKPSGASSYVLRFLRGENADFKVVPHPTAFSAQSAAMSAHISGNNVGKAVMVRLRMSQASEVVMCLLRAPDRIMLEQFAKTTGASHAELLREPEVEELTAKLGLPLEAGAVPALPQLYKLRCFMDAALADDKVVYFNAGSNDTLLSMSMDAFKDLVKPTVVSFAHEIDYNIREVQRMLNKSGFAVHYHVVRHSHTETSPATAKAIGLPPQALIKAVAVSMDGSPALCALCSHQDVDLELLERLAGADSVVLGTAENMRAWFPGVQEDALLPPFGHMYGVPLYLDASVGGWPDAKNAEVAFNAGSSTEVISMRFDDYLRVLRAFKEPVIGHFSTPARFGHHHGSEA